MLLLLLTIFLLLLTYGSIQHEILSIYRDGIVSLTRSDSENCESIVLTSNTLDITIDLDSEQNTSEVPTKSPLPLCVG